MGSLRQCKERVALCEWRDVLNLEGKEWLAYICSLFSLNNLYYRSSIMQILGHYQKYMFIT